MRLSNRIRELGRKGRKGRGSFAKLTRMDCATRLREGSVLQRAKQHISGEDFDSASPACGVRCGGGEEAKAWVQKGRWGRLAVFEEGQGMDSGVVGVI